MGRLYSQNMNGTVAPLLGRLDKLQALVLGPQVCRVKLNLGLGSDLGDVLFGVFGILVFKGVVVDKDIGTLERAGVSVGLALRSLSLVFDGSPRWYHLTEKGKVRRKNKRSCTSQ